MSSHYGYIAVIERGEHIIPILVGGDGPDADCMKVWPTMKQAREEAEQVPLALSFPVVIIDLDDGRN